MTIESVPDFSQCNVKAPFTPAGEEVRVVEPKIDFVFPEVPFPSKKIFAAMGAERITQMVRHHHTLLRKSAIGGMFPSDDAAFEAATLKTADFFIEATGGPKAFTEQYGHPALRERHFRFLIDEKARDIWLMMYKKTLKEVAFPREHLGEFWNWIEPLSIRMINRRTGFEAPRRYPFETVAREFGL
jgi:hemoglobin